MREEGRDKQKDMTHSQYVTASICSIESRGRQVDFVKSSCSPVPSVGSASGNPSPVYHDL